MAGAEDIVARCQAGDKTAQRELYEQFHGRVFRLAARMVGMQDAADVTQQVFLQVFRSLAGFRRSADFSTWLYRVAVNECLQHRRRSKHRFQTIPEELPDRAPAMEQRVEEAELLQKALERVDENQRMVFLLREVEGLSYAQIAEVLGIPAGTVASQLNRVRAELKGFLTEMLSES